MGWLGVAFKVIPMAVEAIKTAEKLVSGRNRGAEKSETAVDLVRSMLHSVEAGADRDILNRPEVEGALRGVISAIIHLLNVVSSDRRS
jgi:hypothetical protein